MSTSFHKPEQGAKTDPFATLFPPNTLLPIKPKTDSVTIFRPIPEIDANGQPRPMVTGFDQFGPLFSNVRIEPIITMAGQNTKFSGFTRCADLPDLNEFDNPWLGTYIRLKSKAKKGELPLDVKAAVDSLTARGETRGAIMPKPSDFVLLQGFCLQHNGKPMAPTYGCLLLSPSAAEAFQRVLIAQATAKVDLFDYDRGFTLVISGEQKPNGRPPEFKVELGAAMPIPDLPAYRNTWVGWSKALVFKTYDDHVRQMAQCYPRNVIAYNAPIKEAMERLKLLEASAPVAAAPAPSFQAAPTSFQAAPAPAPVAQPMTPPVGFGQPVAAPAGFPTTAPAPAANPFGAAPAPAAPMGFPTTVAPTGFAQPVAPAVGFPTTAPAPAAQLSAPASNEELAAEYKRLMEAQNAKPA